MLRYPIMRNLVCYLSVVQHVRSIIRGGATLCEGLGYRRSQMQHSSGAIDGRQCRADGAQQPFS